MTKNITVDIHIGLSYIDSTGNRVAIGDSYMTLLTTMIIALEHFQQRLGFIAPILSSPEIMNCKLNPNIRVIDTQTNPATAVESFIYQVSQNSKPDIVIGSSRSSETAPLAIVAGVQNIPVISYAATASTLSDRTLFRYFSRTVPSDDSVAIAIATLFKNLNYNYIGMLYVSDTYGLAYKDSVNSACDTYGITLFTASFQSADRNSLENAMSDLKRRRLNVIIAVIFDEDLDNLIYAGEKLGMFAPGKLWIFTDSTSVVEHMNVSKKVHDFLRNQFRVFATGVIAENRGYKAFSSEWALFEEYREKINSYLPGGEGYRDYRMQNLKSIMPFMYQLPPGFFKNAHADDFAAFSYDAVVTVLVAACSPSVSLPIKESDRYNSLYKQLLNVAFDGASGYVSFDSKGDRISQNIRLFNIRDDGESSVYKDVGSWNTSSWNIRFDKILFSDDTNVPPRDVDPPLEEKNLLEPSEIIFAYTLFSIAAAYCLGLIIWISVHRESKYVRFSQPEFLVLFLVGNLLVSIDIPVFTIGTPETILGDKWCMLIPWFYSVGSVLKFSSLIVKSYRIYNLFHQTQLTKSAIPLYAIIGFLLFFVSLDIALLIAWTFYSPLYWIVVVIMVDDYNFPKESFGQCSTPDFAFPLAMLIYHVILAIIASVFAYMIRQVPSQYHESRWIHLTTLFLLQLFILSVPGIAAVYDQPRARIYFYAGLIFIEVVVSSSLIILPKIVDHKYRRKSNYNNMEIYLAGRSGGQSSHRNRRQLQQGSSAQNQHQNGDNKSGIDFDIALSADYGDEYTSTPFMGILNKHHVLEKITEEENLTSEGSIVANDASKPSNTSNSIVPQQSSEEKSPSKNDKASESPASGLKKKGSLTKVKGESGAKSDFEHNEKSPKVNARSSNSVVSPDLDADETTNHTTKNDKNAVDEKKDKDSLAVT